ncbi:MAG: hypothetical protein Q4G10_00905 [Bacteroidia bacterium]|nr:hypothetical protein [Bacteroidia bacterium]
MRFDDIIGNGDVKQALVRMVDSGRVPHAIMFYENDGCGAMAIALAFLEYLMESSKVSRLLHPDVHFIFPVTKGSKVSTDKPTSESYLEYWRELLRANPYFLEGGLNEALGIEGKSSLIAIAEAKFIIDKLSFVPLEGGYRAIVVYLPEKMNADTANRLLKSIEEPPENTQFVFITHAPERVLTTISSRCQGIRILPLTKDEVAEVLMKEFGKSEEEAVAAAAVSGGSVGQALDYLADNEDAGQDSTLFVSLMDAMLAKDLLAAQDVAEQLAALPSRERAKSFCRYATASLRKIFMLQQGLPQIAGLTEQEAGPFAGYASRCRKSFVRNAVPYMDKARMLIERNINLKILFCDLVNRLYTII